jgi:thymidylate synthase ThyX
LKVTLVSSSQPSTDLVAQGIELRSGLETQKEHREVAQACAHALEYIFPMVNEFLVK